ncbi:hypothetical protein K439DRAFT_1649156 [Ramaria rubella]|nr:hypothetical protein K439DRAFT_1649156 [Ramaria rubella]
MERGECNDWLHLFLVEGDPNVKISIKHQHEHTAYEDISLPGKWQDFIKDNLAMSRAKIWQHILSQEVVKDIRNVHLPFCQKAVYQFWHKKVQNRWRFCDSPFESALKYLCTQGPDACLGLLDIVTAETGTEALSFQVTDLLRECTPFTQELAMDSTWNMNRQNFELFRAVAEVQGIGIPISYLLISTTKSTPKGSKEKIIAKWLQSLKDKGIHPEFVLTDKDQSEINAVKLVWPHAKDQLCFWHALHAVKQRLAKNKSMPVHYNSTQARESSNFIQASFVPKGQYTSNARDLTLGTCTKDPQYVFCPPEHRLSILRLFARHHTLHSLLPECHGKSCTTDDIYRNSVTDMYTHCERNSLRERTTMMVEAVWRKLKRISLALNRCLRLDFVVHIIATESPLRMSHVNCKHHRHKTSPQNRSP